MLSENTVENLMSPIIDRQESINTYVIGSIANKVREIGQLSPTDIKRMQSLVQYGTDIRQMNSELAKASGKQVKDIKSLIKKVAIDTHLDAKPLYDYRHKSFIPYEKNSKLQQFVRTVGERTSGAYKDLSHSKATGFLIRDLKHPGSLKFQTIGDTYKSIIDEAVQAVLTTGIDYRTAMRKVLRQLSDSGIRRLSWDSGYTQRLDTAVRRNLLEGIRSIQQLVEDEHGKEIGADGKELSAHLNSALDHEPFQGHQFTNEEFEKLQNNMDFQDLKGNHFTAVDRVIGQYNCRHIAYSIIVGVSKPMYSDEKLQSFIDDNHNNGYITPDGKQLTRYECTQEQRKMETKIRCAKERQIVFQQSGDMEAAKLAQQVVQQYTQEYRKFSKACNMSIHKDRITVPDYNFIRF